MSRRMISGIAGLVLLALAIALERALPTHAAAAQVISWTIFVFTMIVHGNYRQRQERWFWKAMASVLLVHALVVITLKTHLPFPTLGVVILLSGLEAVLLQGVVIMVSRSALG